MNYNTLGFPIVEEILTLDNLNPSFKVNHLFSNLVHLVVSNCIDTLDLTANQLDRLRGACANAEFLLEEYWANRIVNRESSLKDFPYYTNYLKLALNEISILQKLFKDLHNRKMLFAGSGPLPLSAILFSFTGLNSSLLDSSKTAIKTSQSLIESLKVIDKNSFSFIQSGILDTDNLGDYDFIFLAALVGVSNSEKERILTHIYNQLNSNQYLVVRSAEGSRTLLYNPIDLGLMNQLGFKLVSEFYPTDEVINSTLVFKK